MSFPLICTNNTLGNIDYGIPIVANKSTDYRTSTGSFHRLIPNKAQEFDCRVKAKIKPELLISDVTIRNETIQSTYGSSYAWQLPRKGNLDFIPQPRKVNNTDYIRNVQERIFKNPPPPKPLPVSEMKDKYYRKYISFETKEVLPPEPYAKCEIKALGRDEQPAIRPEEKGYWKWMDPYVSTNRASYIPFTKDQQNGVARKDIVTFYDAANLPKVKGFGPRNGPATEPLIPKRKIPMTDYVPFKIHPTDRRVRKIVKSVPNFGKKSEYRGNYVKQTFSVMHPYLFQNGVEFPESLSKSSAWQDLAPPGMYCTEYCHLGTGWPVNSIIEYGLPEEKIPHKPCYGKFCDWSQ